MTTKTWIAAVLMGALSVTAMGCSSAEPTAVEEVGADEAALKGISDEDIFEAVFFGHGDAAKKLPEYWTIGDATKVSRAEMKKAEKIRKTYVAGLDKLAPGILRDFADSVRGGDVEKVDALLKSVAARLVDFGELGATDKDKNDKGGDIKNVAIVNNIVVSTSDDKLFDRIRSEDLYRAKLALALVTKLTPAIRT